jgi:hypothetical protein
MQDSGNLICRIIARSLMEQFAPRMAPVEAHDLLNLDAHREEARRLDAALARRDVDAVRNAFDAMSKLHRDSARRAIAALATNPDSRPAEVSEELSS